MFHFQRPLGNMLSTPSHATCFQHPRTQHAFNTLARNMLSTPSHATCFQYPRTQHAFNTLTRNMLSTPSHATFFQQNEKNKISVSKCHFYPEVINATGTPTINWEIPFIVEK